MDKELRLKNKDLKRRLKEMPTDLTTKEIEMARIDITTHLKNENLQHLKDLKTLVEANLTKTTTVNNLIAGLALGFSLITFTTTTSKINSTEVYIYQFFLVLTFLYLIRTINRDNKSAVVLKVYLEIINDLIIDREKDLAEKIKVRENFKKELKRRQEKSWKPLD